MRSRGALEAVLQSIFQLLVAHSLKFCENADKCQIGVRLFPGIWLDS